MRNRNGETPAYEAELAALRETLQKTKDLAKDMERYRREVREQRNAARKISDAMEREYRFRMAAEQLKKISADWITEGVPVPAGEVVRADAGEGSYVMYRAGATRADFDAYLTALAESGFSIASETEEGNVIFARYVSKDAVVFVSFADCAERALHVRVDHKDRTALVPQDLICNGTPDVTEPMIVLMGDHLYEKVDCGMSYVIRCTDGSFILIDGGWSFPEITDALYERLERLSEGRPIIISAWIFSHPHVDHIGAYFGLGRRHGDKITLKRVIVNNPGETRLTELGDGSIVPYVRGFRAEADKYLGETEFFHAAAGDRFHFPGVDIDMLLTFDDHAMPHALTDCNDCSLIFRVRAAGQKYLFFTDMSTIEADILVARYGKLLKSDAVQVAHHGYWGGTEAAYDAVAAPIVFWPCPYIHPVTGDARYNTAEGSPIEQKTRDWIAKYAKRTFLLFEGTKELTLPISAEPETTAAEGGEQ